MGGATSAKEAEAIKAELAARAMDAAAFGQIEYDEIVAKARELAVAKVAKQRATKEKKLKAAFKKEAEAAIADIPMYQMIDEVMEAGGFKYDNVLSLYSTDWIGEIQRARPGIISHNGRAYADDMAMQYGYDSADALLQDVLYKPSKKEAIENYYDSLVREYESNLEYENSEIYAEVLQNEIDIINKMLGKPKRDKKIKGTIKEKTGQKKTPELKELAAQFKRDEQVAIKEQHLQAAIQQAEAEQLQNRQTRETLKTKYKMNDQQADRFLTFMTDPKNFDLQNLVAFNNFMEATKARGGIKPMPSRQTAAPSSFAPMPPFAGGGAGPQVGFGDQTSAIQANDFMSAGLLASAKNRNRVQ
jgi:hypothetical protein